MQIFAINCVCIRPVSLFKCVLSMAGKNNANGILQYLERPLGKLVCHVARLLCNPFNVLMGYTERGDR